MSILKNILHPSRIVKAGRSMAISGLLYLAASAFVFASVIMISIEIGSRLVRGSGAEQSGLWVSALLIFIIAALSAGAGRYITLRHREEKERLKAEMTV